MRLDGNSGLPLPRLQRILKRIITLHTPQDSTEFFCDRCSQKGSISPRFKKINKINESKKASAECASRRRHATRLVPDLQEICGNFTRPRAPQRRLLDLAFIPAIAKLADSRRDCIVPRRSADNYGLLIRLPLWNSHSGRSLTGLDRDKPHSSP